MTVEVMAVDAEPGVVGIDVMSPAGVLVMATMHHAMRCAGAMGTAGMTNTRAGMTCGVPRVAVSAPTVASGMTSTTRAVTTVAAGMASPAVPTVTPASGHNQSTRAY